MRFWKKTKNEAQNGLEYSVKTPFFELKLFFQRPLKNFLWTLCTCSRYLKGLPNLVLWVCKKIVTARHNNTKILTKNRQKNRFCITSLGMTVKEINSFEYSLSFLKIMNWHDFFFQFSWLIFDFHFKKFHHR